MSEKEIKVTDKRMFTSDGQLREDFRHLEEVAPAAPAASEPAERSGASQPGAAEKTQPEAAPRAAAGGADGSPLEIPGTPTELGAPSFFDLLSVLAEPVPLYLGDARLPDGESMQNLPVARFYIDLLDLLRDKTAGNLTAQESTALEQALYQLRMRYVQKRG